MLESRPSYEHGSFSPEHESFASCEPAEAALDAPLDRLEEEFLELVRNWYRLSSESKLAVLNRAREALREQE